MAKKISRRGETVLTIVGDFCPAPSTAGWPVQGVWPLNADPSDVLSVVRAAGQDVCCTGQADGYVRVFRWPAVAPQVYTVSAVCGGSVSGQEDRWVGVGVHCALSLGVTLHEYVCVRVCARTCVFAHVGGANVCACVRAHQDGESNSQKL